MMKKFEGELPPASMEKAQAVWEAIAGLYPNIRQITLQVLPNLFTPGAEIVVGGVFVRADGVGIPVTAITMGGLAIIRHAPGITHEVSLIATAADPEWSGAAAVDPDGESG